jgi:hypothetical protein
MSPVSTFPSFPSFPVFPMFPMFPMFLVLSIAARIVDFDVRHVLG